MKFLINILFFSIYLFSSGLLFGQVKGSFGKGKDKIKLERADRLEGGKKIIKFKGNVVFSQQGTMLYCDSAYQYKKENIIDAFGNVRIQQGDSVMLTGDKLNYNGDTRKAILTGRTVFLRDKTMTLTTKYLEYDLKSKLAYYVNGGTIVDGNTTLTSDLGYYSTSEKEFRFKKNVRVVNPLKKYSLQSDTLHYNSTTKIATFLGPSKIESADGTVEADHGIYNTVTGESDFKAQTGAHVKSGSYILTGEHITYGEKSDRGTVRKNVKMISEKDQIIIEGDMAHYWGDKGISKVYGNVLMKNLVSGDTLYLKADTLISIDNPKDPSKKRLLAYNNARFFKSDLQGKCDSLVYNFADSTIYLYRDPVLWNDENQISADSINILLVNQKIHKMNMAMNSFIVSQDTLRNFNQVKGKNMTAHFREENIYQVDVDGNGETIYFALENEKKLTGMNKVACSNMIIRFERNKVKTISFIEKPDGKFIPPQLIEEPEKKLKGFKWRDKERPKLISFLHRK